MRGFLDGNIPLMILDGLWTTDLTTGNNPTIKGVCSKYRDPAFLPSHFSSTFSILPYLLCISTGERFIDICEALVSQLFVQHRQG